MRIHGDPIRCFALTGKSAGKSQSTEKAGS
jgi:hypothetical protein